MLRKITHKDVNQITEIHMSSWDKHILLTKLGPKFLHDCFYGPLVRSKYAFGFVSCKGDRIIGYATGFSDYPAFVHKNPKMTLGRLIALWKFLTFQVSWKDILDAMNEVVKYRKLKDPRFQLSALALRNEYKGTPEGRRAITECINRVLKECSNRKAKSVWGVTYKQNVPMKKYFYKMGFGLVEEIKLRGRVELVFEKVF